MHYIVCETLEDALAGSTTIVSGAIEPLLLEELFIKIFLMNLNLKTWRWRLMLCFTRCPIATEWFVRDKSIRIKYLKMDEAS